MANLAVRPGRRDPPAALASFVMPTPGSPTVNDLIDTALVAAEAAAAIHRRDRGLVDVEAASEKGRADYVSRTDLDAQKAALAVIRARHPGHGVLAEEEARDLKERVAEWDGSPLWVVDPLDGTTNFLHGHPQFAASVAVWAEGEPLAGAVVCAPTGERWWAARGQGAFKGGRRISVSRARPLRDALVGTGFPFKMLGQMTTYLGQLDRVLRSSAGIRRAGSAAIDLCYLAQGSLDAFWELVLSPWDWAAGLLIAREAGGVVTRVDGSPVDLLEGPIMGASSEELLSELRELVA